jgi:uncharacterized protein YabN with tetrapyrrole methylase and pyrophosphatase domain
LENWEKIKQRERAGKDEDASAVAGVPLALPALHRAKRMGEKAISHGFRWSDVDGALAKVREEVGELEREVEAAGAGSERRAELEGEARARVEHELGDVLLATAFLGCYVRIDPERAAREALRRFERRFRAVEADLDRPLSECSLDEMLAAWGRAKVADGTAGPDQPRT